MWLFKQLVQMLMSLICIFIFSFVEMSLLHSTMMNSADEVAGYVISHKMNRSIMEKTEFKK